jgi:hypothetical protein
MAFSVEPGFYLEGGTGRASRTSSRSQRRAARVFNVVDRDLVVV